MSRSRRGGVVALSVLTPMLDAVQALPDAELRSLARHLKGVGRTNCWWLTFEARLPLTSLVEMERAQRRLRKRAQKRTEATR